MLAVDEDVEVLRARAILEQRIERIEVDVGRHGDVRLYQVRDRQPHFGTPPLEHLYPDGVAHCHPKLVGERRAQHEALPHWLDDAPAYVVEDRLQVRLPGDAAQAAAVPARPVGEIGAHDAHRFRRQHAAHVLDVAHDRARLRLRKADHQVLPLGVEEIALRQVIDAVAPLQRHHQQSH